ncbi:hypothetical protein [Frankia tisae]|uniref:hypothetical protein n=1 Tax=Frankia tisae TaxID=2950104 RepID=UPI0021C2401E|nr:hypothetical protein [Frankia tisae]
MGEDVECRPGLTGDASPVSGGDGEPPPDDRVDGEGGDGPGGESGDGGGVAEADRGFRIEAAQRLGKVPAGGLIGQLGAQIVGDAAGGAVPAAEYGAVRVVEDGGAAGVATLQRVVGGLAQGGRHELVESERGVRRIDEGIGRQGFAGNAMVGEMKGVGQELEDTVPKTGSPATVSTMSVRIELSTTNSLKTRGPSPMRVSSSVKAASTGSRSTKRRCKAATRRKRGAGAMQTSDHHRPQCHRGRCNRSRSRHAG